MSDGGEDLGAEEVTRSWGHEEGRIITSVLEKSSSRAKERLFLFSAERMRVKKNHTEEKGVVCLQTGAGDGQVQLPAGGAQHGGAPHAHQHERRRGPRPGDPP